jgi:carbon-monoxide dehydrogenase large subunit
VRRAGEPRARIGAKLLQAKARGCAAQSAARWWAPRGASRWPTWRAPGIAGPQDLPGDVNASGLEVTAGYKAKRDTGTFSYAAHAAVVAGRSETGELEILDYVVVEDGGVLVNP